MDLSALPVINMSLHPNVFDDGLSVDHSQSSCSRKMSRMAASHLEDRAYEQHQFSIYPQTTVDFGQFDSAYPLDVQ